MPVVSKRGGGAAYSSRVAPYPSLPPTGSLEGHAVQENTPALQLVPGKEKSTGRSAAKGKSNPNQDSERPGNYRDIELDEIGDEIPCYENASVIRRKLNNLITKKTPIPGSSKTFNKTTLANELHLIAQAHHPIQSTAGFDNVGPSVQALTRFLKKSGSMGGGDSHAYYYGNMLLEKLRIWNGEKKTKARLKAEEQYPTGHMRIDPDTARFLYSDNDPITRADVATLKRNPVSLR